MTSRKPVKIVELEQPRCSLRFGEGACTASIDDGPRCYQTWATCLDQANITPTGRIRWRFSESDAGLFPTYDQDGPDDIGTNPIPCLTSVSHSAGRINVAAASDDVSALGLRSQIRVNLKDVPWQDEVGDFYRELRPWWPNPLNAGFWSLWAARNEYLTGMYITRYEGYEGQALADMVKSVFVLSSISGPDASGNVSLIGNDPLQLTGPKKALFPRSSDLQLVADISNGEHGNITLSGNRDDLETVFGNVAGVYHLRIGSEILSYTGITDHDVGEYRLSGVQRGVLGTVSDSHSADDAAQRVGRFELHPLIDTIDDMLTAYASVPASFVPSAEWTADEGIYVSGITVTMTVAEPIAVEEVLSEICRDCAVYLWWDERAQKIQFRSIRPQNAEFSLNWIQHIKSASVRREDDQRLTRVTILYGEIDPTESRDDPTNYRGRYIDLNVSAELPAAGNEIRERITQSRIITSSTQAFQSSSRILGRLGRAPRYMTIMLDAKDGDLEMGDVVIIDAREEVTSEGYASPGRWQVISREEVDPGYQIKYELQEFQFPAARLGTWMADDAPDWLDVPVDDRETIAGGWWADDDGNLPDGSAGFVWQ